MIRFTGKNIKNIKGFDNKKNILNSLKTINFKKTNKINFQNYFENTWALTEILFSSIISKKGFYIPPPHNLRHPLIFYYGHPAVLYINKMYKAGLIKNTIDPIFEKKYDVGVDEMSWDDMSKNNMKWDDIKDVNKYRKEAYKIIENTINNQNDILFKKIDLKNPLWSILMGFEHDRIHLETSSVLIREMNISYFKKPDYFSLIYKNIINDKYELDHKMIPIKSKNIILGRNNYNKNSYDNYGWDNEYGYKNIKVNNFYAAETLTSNRQFMEFVKSGGYSDESNWCDDGLKWKKFTNSQHPKFWIKKDKGFYLRTIFEEIILPLNFPVIVNYYEANSYIKWYNRKTNKNYRLPNEAEYKIMRGNESNFKKNNINLIYSSSFDFNNYLITTAYNNYNQKSMHEPASSRNLIPLPQIAYVSDPVILVDKAYVNFSKHGPKAYSGGNITVVMFLPRASKQG